MNCKQGDLAVFVRSEAGNEGVIVRCLRLATTKELADNLFPVDVPRWVVDRGINTTWGRFLPFASDKSLRPIRPGDGEDEMLRIAGKPQDVVA
jgi:hypothetical protein